MKDIFCELPDGRRVLVAETPTPVLLQSLDAAKAGTLHCVGGATRNRVRDRIEIELIARRIGVSGPAMS